MIVNRRKAERNEIVLEWVEIFLDIKEIEENGIANHSLGKWRLPSR